MEYRRILFSGNLTKISVIISFVCMFRVELSVAIFLHKYIKFSRIYEESFYHIGIELSSRKKRADFAPLLRVVWVKKEVFLANL